MDLTFILSIWGAVLSSILSVMKIIEYWNNRFQIDVSPILRGSDDVGHDISIKNLSSKPVLLEYMEIFQKIGNEEKRIWSPEDAFINARIDPFDSKVFNFSEADYFLWKKGTYIRLHFAGRKTINRSIV